MAACPPPPPPPPHRNVTRITSQVVIEDGQQGQSRARSVSPRALIPRSDPMSQRSRRAYQNPPCMVQGGRSAGPPRQANYGYPGGAYPPAQNPQVQPDHFAACQDFSVPSSQETPDIFQNTYGSDIPDTCMAEFNQVNFSVPSSQETPEGWYLNRSLNSTPNLDFSDEFNPQCVDFSVPSSQETPEGWYPNQSLNSTPNLDFSDQFNPQCVDFSVPSSQETPDIFQNTYGSDIPDTCMAEFNQVNFSVPSSQETPEGWYHNRSLNSTPNLDFSDQFNPQCVDFSVPSSQETPEGWYLNRSLNSTPNLDFSDEFNPECVDFSVPSSQETPEGWYLNQSLNSTPDLDFMDYSCPTDQGMPPADWGYCDDPGEIPTCPSPPRSPGQHGQGGRVTCRPPGRSPPPPPPPPPCPAAPRSRPPTPMSSPDTNQNRSGCPPIEDSRQGGRRCLFGRSPPSPPSSAVPWSRPPTPMPSPNTVQMAQQRRGCPSPSTPSTPSTVVSQNRSGCEPVEGPSQGGRGRCRPFGGSPQPPPSPPCPPAPWSRPPTPMPSPNTMQYSQQGNCPSYPSSPSTPSTVVSQRPTCEDTREMQRWCKDIEKRFERLKQELNEQCPPLSSDIRQKLIKSQDKVNKGINRLKYFIEDKSRQCR